MLAARGDFRFICDTDLSMPIEDVVKFLPPLTTGYDLMIATREAPVRTALENQPTGILWAASIFDY